MPYYLTKVLPLLLMPVSIALTGCLMALFLILAGKRKTAVFFLLLSIVVLWSTSLPVVAGRMLWSLERQFPPVLIDETPTCDCILVLGGALSPAIYPRTDIELTEATDRVYQAARLYRQGKGAHVIVAAGNQPWSGELVPEAELIERLLLEWGVPRHSILLEPDSKSTYENAVNAQPLIVEAGCETSLLVTSVWHMPRARAAFEKAGIAVVPYSVDVRFAQGASVPMTQFVPTAEALAASSLVIREWMGIWVYRWRGWIE